jgi:hypothetical protein
VDPNVLPGVLAVAFQKPGEPNPFIIGGIVLFIFAVFFLGLFMAIWRVDR